MSLKQWLDNGWLRRHKTSAKEISDLSAITARDLKGAKEGNTEFLIWLHQGENAAPIDFEITLKSVMKQT